jgi:hypothetical protein
MDERRQLFAPAVALKVSVEMALTGAENDGASHSGAKTGKHMEESTPQVPLELAKRVIR